MKIIYIDRQSAMNLRVFLRCFMQHADGLADIINKRQRYYPFYHCLCAIHIHIHTIQKFSTKNRVNTKLSLFDFANSMHNVLRSNFSFITFCCAIHRMHCTLYAEYSNTQTQPIKEIGFLYFTYWIFRSTFSIIDKQKFPNNTINFELSCDCNASLDKTQTSIKSLNDTLYSRYSSKATQLVLTSSDCCSLQ